MKRYCWATQGRAQQYLSKPVNHNTGNKLCEYWGTGNNNIYCYAKNTDYQERWRWRVLNLRSSRVLKHT